MSGRARSTDVQRDRKTKALTKARRLRNDLRAYPTTPGDPAWTAALQRRAIIDLIAAVLALTQAVRILDGTADASDEDDPGA
jgi:hypothetical protein